MNLVKYKYFTSSLVLPIDNGTCAHRVFSTGISSGLTSSKTVSFSDSTCFSRYVGCLSSILSLLSCIYLYIFCWYHSLSFAPVFTKLDFR